MKMLRTLYLYRTFACWAMSFYLLFDLESSFDLWWSNIYFICRRTSLSKYKGKTLKSLSQFTWIIDSLSSNRFLYFYDVISNSFTLEKFYYPQAMVSETRKLLFVFCKGARAFLYGKLIRYNGVRSIIQYNKVVNHNIFIHIVGVLKQCFACGIV